MIDLSRAEWRKSSRSGTSGQCVEVARLDGAAAVRDSKYPHRALVLAPAQLAGFVSDVKTGTFDR